jgi:hypothetical protein
LRASVSAFVRGSRVAGREIEQLGASRSQNRLSTGVVWFS